MPKALLTLIFQVVSYAFCLGQASDHNPTISPSSLVESTPGLVLLKEGLANFFAQVGLKL
jgi:hypothetical protein